MAGQAQKRQEVIVCELASSSCLTRLCHVGRNSITSRRERVKATPGLSFHENDVKKMKGSSLWTGSSLEFV